MPYCERCDLDFFTQRGLQRHEDLSARHWVCERCQRDYPSWKDLETHYVRSPQHMYCEYCEENFKDAEELDQHFIDAHYCCRACSTVYLSERKLDDHNRKTHVWFCTPCGRVFRSEYNLTAHLNSRTHTPKRVCCPYARCRRTFMSLSALCLHFEGGKCPSGMTRDALLGLLARADRTGVVTCGSKRRLRGDDSDVSEVEVEEVEEEVQASFDALIGGMRNIAL